jgi:hypothetical protein
LPRLPDRYRVDVIDRAKRPAADDKPGPALGNKISTGGGVPPVTDPDPESGSKRLRINTSVNPAWKEKMERSNLRLKDLEGDAPESKEKDPRTSKPVTVCLSWHLLGQCFSNCRRGKTHRSLHDAELAGMTQLVLNKLNE